MSSIQIKLNRGGVGAMLKSHEVKERISEEAERIASSAGTQYQTDVKYMNTRVISSVYTTKKQQDYNDLLRALS